VKRPLAGKRVFEAMGRRAQSLGYATVRPYAADAWPEWASDAYTRGYLLNKQYKIERLFDKVTHER